MDAEYREQKRYVSSALTVDPDHVPVAQGLYLSREDHVDIIGVRFRSGGKIYYFYPDVMQCAAGDHVVVETVRGMEFGTVCMPNASVEVKSLVLPLRRVLRRATEQDIARHEENERKREDARRICIEKIREHGVEMKLVDVEYAFDNSKLMFYFTADGRVDFRELVKDLAGIFHTRIELRQIGIRDEAKLVGGLGICGRPLCCASFLNDFAQVSIKMAKEQNLSLNSAKISGTCGRLMCCLRYEYDVYSEEVKKTPKVDSLVSTPDGEAIVTETTPLAGLVRVRFTGDRRDTPMRVYHRDDVTLLKTKKERRQEEKNRAQQAADAQDKAGKEGKNGKEAVPSAAEHQAEHARANAPEHPLPRREEAPAHTEQPSPSDMTASNPQKPENADKSERTDNTEKSEKESRPRRRRGRRRSASKQGANRDAQGNGAQYAGKPAPQGEDKVGAQNQHRPHRNSGVAPQGADNTAASVGGKQQKSLKNYGFGDADKK